MDGFVGFWLQVQAVLTTGFEPRAFCIPILRLNCSATPNPDQICIYADTEGRTAIIIKACWHSTVSVHVILGYVYKGLHIFRSIWDQIHYGTDLISLHRTGSKLEQFGSICSHLHNGSHLVQVSRSDLICTRSTKSHVNMCLIHTNFVPVPNRSAPV